MQICFIQKILLSLASSCSKTVKNNSESVKNAEINQILKLKKHPFKKVLPFILISILPFPKLIACFWDYDTIEMERKAFPSVLELISGKFLRHSPEYHYWRIKDREEKLETFPDSIGLLDDLAVSYSKTGNQIKAIEIILKKEAKSPGLYETQANLGTFYLHAGQLEKGINHISKAIQINPEAHFRREIYQKYVAEYVLSKMDNGKLALPLDRTYPKHPDHYLRNEAEGNFYGFLMNKVLGPNTNNRRRTLPMDELEKAVKGITGMMKFGDHSSPILLEILGDLLMNQADKFSARQLAARAYFRASEAAKDSGVADAYMKKIVYGLYHQFTAPGGTKFSPSDLKKLLDEEIEIGNTFYQQIRQDEINWILNGLNPEEEFQRKYYENPIIEKRVQTGKETSNQFQESYIKNEEIGKNVTKIKLPIASVVMDSTIVAKIDSIFTKSVVQSVNSVTEEINSNFTPWYQSGIFRTLSLVALSILMFITIKLVKNKSKQR